jgi:hypothetical protein
MTVDLRTAKPFAVLASSAVTSTGQTVLDGSVGVSPGTAIGGFPPGKATAVNRAGTAPLQAQSDLSFAYSKAAGQDCVQDLTGKDLGGLTLRGGVRRFSSSAGLTGTLTLDGGGDPHAWWLFQIGSTLTTASTSVVRLVNNAQPGNVFWQVGSSATLGTGCDFVGSIMAQVSITATTGTVVRGRLLARSGAITLDSVTVTIPT